MVHLRSVACVLLIQVSIIRGWVRELKEQSFSSSYSGARYASRTKISAKQVERVEEPVQTDVSEQAEDFFKDLQEKVSSMQICIGDPLTHREYARLTTSGVGNMHLHE
jgi:hypothetical protein